MTHKLLWLPLLELVWIIVMCLFFHERGRRRGYRQGLKEGHFLGYQRGQQNADRWWLDSEQAVDQERQKIWKEQSE